MVALGIRKLRRLSLIEHPGGAMGHPQACAFVHPSTSFIILSRGT